MQQLLEVLEGFSQYGDNAYYQLILKLKQDYPNEVALSLLKTLNVSDVSLERRFDYAQLLIELGEVDGVNFIFDQMQGHESLPWGRDDRFRLEKIDTTFVLKRIEPQLDVMLQDREKTSMRKDVKSIIFDFLFSLASKSERDLLLVDNFLKDAEIRFRNQSSELSMLHRYRQRILENFRDANTGHTPLIEVIRIINRLENAII